MSGQKNSKKSMAARGCMLGEGHLYSEAALSVGFV